MTIVHMDGFDSYKDLADLGTEYSLISGAFVFNTSGGRFGGGAIQGTSSGNSQIWRILSPSLSQIWMGYALYVTSFGSTYTSLFYNGEFSIGYNAGNIKFYKGSIISTNVGTVSGTISTNTWHWIDIKCICSTTVGVIELWVDGVQLATYSGNTSNSGASTFSYVQIGSSLTVASGLVGYIDDWCVIDATQAPNNTRLGDCKIETLVPTSNAGPNNGTASAGTNYQCVDEAQYNTTDYVTITGTSNQEELYGMGDLATPPLQVFGARLVAVSQKGDAGPSLIKPILVSNSHESAATAMPVLTSWNRQYGIFETDPNTSAAWTGAGINAVQAGVKIA